MAHQGWELWSLRNLCRSEQCRRAYMLSLCWMLSHWREAGAEDLLLSYYPF